MKVTLLVQLSGSKFSLEPGDEHDFPQDEAVRLIKAGFAVPVVESPIERAVIDPVVEMRDEDDAINAAAIGRHRNKKRRR